MTWPSACRWVRRVGTIAPWATRRTAATATRPSQRTLAPTPSSSPSPPPTADQPAERVARPGSTGRRPGRRRAGRRRVHGSSRRAGPPRASRRSASSSFGGRRRCRGPPAHTTIAPAAHDAWSRTSPAGSAAAMSTRTRCRRPRAAGRRPPRAGRARPRSRPPPGSARGPRAGAPSRGCPRCRRAGARGRRASGPGRPRAGGAARRWRCRRPPPTRQLPALARCQTSVTGRSLRLRPADHPIGGAPLMASERERPRTGPFPNLLLRRRDAEQGPVYPVSRPRRRISAGSDRRARTIRRASRPGRPRRRACRSGPRGA